LNLLTLVDFSTKRGNSTEITFSITSSALEEFGNKSIRKKHDQRQTFHTGLVVPQIAPSRDFKVESRFVWRVHLTYYKNRLVRSTQQKWVESYKIWQCGGRENRKKAKVWRPPQGCFAQKRHNSIVRSCHASLISYGDGV